MVLTRIQYLDGSGNQYIVKKRIKRIIEYIPMKPLLSSSGIYDGGDYVKQKVNKQQFHEVISLIKRAIVNEDNKIENRVKGSGMIVLHKIFKKELYLLRPGSNDLYKIETKLHELISYN
ncbi:MAG: hypothetical protein EAX89_14660 [Candidatus Lokiarchaeota archaeon]|nr:hypothetical protein [Candidatus Lokiarchaeota archaeon]